VAADRQIPLIISDGPPGIGCPVIASLSGVSLALVVTEPTVSGLHDLQRVLALARHFSVPTAVCVNKWDINPQQADRIEAAARSAGAEITGRIRFDRTVTRAQLQQKAVVELDSAAGDDIRKVWHQTQRML
jgi:MinD superfamily P-loop ATPase